MVLNYFYDERSLETYDEADVEDEVKWKNSK